jgi:hypothetical protein
MIYCPEFALACPEFVCDVPNLLFAGVPGEPYGGEYDVRCIWEVLGRGGGQDLRIQGGFG